MLLPKCHRQAHVMALETIAVPVLRRHRNIIVPPVPLIQFTQRATSRSCCAVSHV
jgi:hypothetical protein